MKYTRIIMGSVLVVAGLWVVIGEQMSGASSDAVINARITTLRSEVAGKLDLKDRALGTRVDAGEMMFSVQNLLSDSVHLNDLLLEERLARAKQARIEAELASSKDLRAKLLERAGQYRRSRVLDLTTQLEHARAQLALLEDFANADQASGPDVGRLMSSAPLVAAVDSDVVGPQNGGAADLELAIERARERVDVLTVALKSADNGVFLGDGYNDAPNSEQRAGELEIRIGQLTAERSEAMAEVEALTQRIGRERVRVNALTGGDIASPVDGLYWEVLQADGVTVQQGDPVLRIVDCQSTMITASVTERVYNSLSVGQSASVRILGDARTFQATIQRLAGSGAATLYENLAVPPDAKHLERYDVALLVPGLTSDQNLGCAVGRTGRVFFDRRPLDWLRSWFG